MFYVITVSAKYVKKLLRRLGRGGSLPGFFVLRLMPKYLRRLKLPKKIIIITATNGKSTITNTLAKVLERDGQYVVCNVEGNNMKAGIVSLLLDHIDLSGKCRADVLVLEVDELSVPRVMEDIVPSHVLVGNLFRDQLDRVGEMETVIRKLEASFASYPNHLVLNGDDPNVCRLALKAKHAHVTYFGVSKHSQATTVSSEASEGRFCPICNNELIYDYYQYSHIGRFHCLFDQFGQHKIAYQGQLIDQSRKDQSSAAASSSSLKYVVNDVIYTSRFNSLFAIYNELGVIALASMLEVQPDVIKDVLASFQMNNGRMEQFTLPAGQTCVLNLAKNPTGFNESMKTMTASQEDCVFGLVLNDEEADGIDVSWIYDTNFELLNQPHIKALYVAGSRMYDLALRLHYANCKQPIVPINGLDELVKQLDGSGKPVYLIANYTALQPVRKALQRGRL